MSEIDTQRRIQAELGKNRDIRLWRNNVGHGWVGRAISVQKTRLGASVLLEHARQIKFGLTPGSSDLIGFRSILITPDMVGQRVAVFAAVECKSPHAKPSHIQQTFVHVCDALGAYAGIARDTDDARKILCL